MKDIVINGVALKVNEVRIAEGRPTIIFLHDSLGCIALWRDFPEKLGEATNCNVLVYDRQGYGWSQPFRGNDRSNDYMELEADVLNSLIEQCGITKAILFGHSDGGTIALIAAAKYPERIMGIITEGAHIFVEDITLQGIRDAVLSYHTTNLKDRLEKYHGGKTDSVFRAWADTWLKKEYRSWNIEHFLPKINCPVLAIQGEGDEYGSMAQVDGIVNQVAGKARKLMIRDVGHTPHREARDVVMQESIGFVRFILVYC